MNGVQVFERIQAFGARAEFAGRLWAADQKDTHQRRFVAMKIEDVGEAMLEFGDATVGGRGSGQVLLGE